MKKIRRPIKLKKKGPLIKKTRKNYKPSFNRYSQDYRRNIPINFYQKDYRRDVPINFYNKENMQGESPIGLGLLSGIAAIAGAGYYHRNAIGNIIGDYWQKAKDYVSSMYPNK